MRFGVPLGVGTGSTFSPAFVSLGSSGQDVFSTGNGTGEVWRVDATTGDRTLVSSAANGIGPALGNLFDLVVAPDGMLLVASAGGLGGSPAIFSIDPVTGDRIVVSSSALAIGTGPVFSRPQSVVVKADGNLVVADGATGSLFLVDPSTGNRLDLSSSAMGTGPAFVEPLGLAIFPIPEPSTALLMGLGLLAMGARPPAQSGTGKA
jgi:outer membrane protein assembly factor BamB